MTAGPQMRSTEYYRIHNEKIEEQSRDSWCSPGALVSGDKKDVVVTNLLDSNPGRIAIYGWHRAQRRADSAVEYGAWRLLCRLQPRDSAGQRNGHRGWPVPIDLRCSSGSGLARVLSDEGPIPNLRAFMTRTAANACGEPSRAARKTYLQRLCTQRNPK